MTTDIHIAPSEGHIFIDREARQDPKQIVDAIRAAATGAFNLAERIAFFTASVGGHDAAKAFDGNFGTRELNDACVELFISLFTLAGGNVERARGVEHDGYRHDYVLVSNGKKRIAVDPTFGIVFRHETGELTGLMDWAREKSSAWQMVLTPFSRMPYSGLNLENSKPVENVPISPSLFIDGFDIREHFKHIAAESAPWLLTGGKPPAALAHDMPFKVEMEESNSYWAILERLKKRCGSAQEFLTRLTSLFAVALDARLDERHQDFDLLTADGVAAQWCHGEAECGARVEMFARTCERYGIDHRQTEYFNVPIQCNHAAIEAFVEDQWRFFDPTLGIVATNQDSEDCISAAQLCLKWPEVRLWKTRAGFATGVGKLTQGVDLGFIEVADQQPILSPRGEIIALVRETFITSRPAIAGFRSRLEIPFVWDMETNTKLDLPMGTFSVGQKVHSEYGQHIPSFLERLGQYGGCDVAAMFYFVSRIPLEVHFRINLETERFALRDIMLSVEPAVAVEPLGAKTSINRRTVHDLESDHSEYTGRFIITPPATAFRVQIPFGEKREVTHWMFEAEEYDA